VRYAGYLVCVEEMRNACNILVGEPEDMEIDEKILLKHKR
jgi:hypothetical protein